jgi:phosphinothricin acetyltransferase
MSSVEYRIASARDAPAIAEIYAPYVRDTIITFEIDAPDASEIGERIRRIGAQYPWIAALAAGELVGYAYACENRSRLAYRWSVDAAVYLHPSAQRRGIGRGLYARLFALLRALGYVNAFAGITLPNAASVGLHEALGFTLIGVYRDVGYKMAAWRDVGWWQLALCEPPRRPIEPVAIGDLDEATLDAILAGGATAQSLTG